jgi:hypothetical protein
MDRYLCTATVQATVHYGDRHDPAALLGVSGEPGDDPKQRVFGLVSGPHLEGVPDRLTHMCYALDYFDPAFALEFSAARDGWFYFQTGNGRYQDVKVSTEELRRAFTALGLLPQAAEGGTS